MRSMHPRLGDKGKHDLQDLEDLNGMQHPHGFRSSTDFNTFDTSEAVCHVFSLDPSRMDRGRQCCKAFPTAGVWQQLQRHLATWAILATTIQDLKGSKMFSNFKSIAD